MQALPSFTDLILLVMPLLGLGILTVVLTSMIANRDRWIVPGTIMVLLAVAGLAMAIEYGDSLRSLMEKPEPVAEEPAPIVAAVEEPEPVITPPPETTPEPVDDEPKWIPAAETPREEPSGRRTVVVNPTAPARREYIPPPPPPKPREEVKVAPKPEPVKPEPEPKPAIVAPPPAPMPTAKGRGTLVVRIKGPIVETAKTPSSSPHILFILDRSKVDIRSPSRTSEQYQEGGDSGNLLAVTYFWEDITVSFPNLEPGWHTIMIDTSLESARTHQSQMVGASQDQNDWNGTIEIGAGQTTVIEFGTKNWMGGKLNRIR